MRSCDFMLASYQSKNEMLIIIKVESTWRIQHRWTKSSIKIKKSQNIHENVEHYFPSSESGGEW